jgi:bifunctional oligoribonuclease and PAP phosphatase NrnA
MSLDRLVSFVRRHRQFVVTAHETPDGDAIGSEMAMLRALTRLGKVALVRNADPAPANLDFLDPGHEIVVVSSPSDLPADLEEYALLVLDVSDPLNTGAVSRLVLPRARDCFFIDHHEITGRDPEHNYVDRNASSTCEILYRLLGELGVEIDFEIAQPLFVGVVYDTGNFVYPKTTASTFDMAHRLVDAGVSPSEIYTRLYECRTVSFLKLQARVLATLEFHYDCGVAVQTLTRNTIMESGSAYEEAQTLINTPLSAEKVRVSVFFKENMEGLFRCSLRSKGNIDVAAVAESYRGGGHRTAAGFKLDRPLEAVKAEVLRKLAPYFTPAGHAQ